jgi:mannosyl-oligosaccharide alpha-1,3-glucosidase
MPVDNIWLDIEYAKERRYFQFDEDYFKNLHTFLDKIEKHKKRLTIITDPHIKVDSEYFVYKHGTEVKIATDEDGSPIRGAFIRDASGKDPFIGECWPKSSVWVDYLNENA